jgi:dihydrofolate reductase
MRRLIEITFMSSDGVIDDPEIVKEAQRYFSAEDEQAYQKEHLFAADALLLGRKTYEKFAKAYPAMEKGGNGVPVDFVQRMNSIPKFVASKTLKDTTWNASLLHGDIADEVRKLKRQDGKDIIKYGTGTLDRVLFGERLIDRLCLIHYPFILGHGTHLLDGLGITTHLQLSDVKRFKSGTLVLEYVPVQ